MKSLQSVESPSIEELASSDARAIATSSMAAIDEVRVHVYGEHHTFY